MNRESESISVNHPTLGYYFLGERRGEPNGLSLIKDQNFVIGNKLFPAVNEFNSLDGWTH